MTDYTPEQRATSDTDFKMMHLLTAIEPDAFWERDRRLTRLANVWGIELRGDQVKTIAALARLVLAQLASEIESEANPCNR